MVFFCSRDRFSKSSRGYHVIHELPGYLKTLYGARVAPGGFGFRTIFFTNISHKKIYTAIEGVPLPLQD